MTNRAGIENPDVIDVVSHDSTGEEWKLIIVETSEWNNSPEKLQGLQKKLNNYLHFALDGQMQQAYPKSRGKRIAIQIDFYERPDSSTLEFLDLARQRIRAEGVQLYVNVIPDVTLRG